MAKINEYPLERFTFGDDDYYDIDYWDGAVYQSAKIKGSTIRAAMSGGGSILAADGQVMPADRSQDLANFKLSLRDGVFTLGTVDADFGSIFQATKDSGNTYATIKTKTNDNAALILDINTADVTGAGNKTAFIQFRDAGVSKYIFGTNTDGVANFSDNSFFISSSAQLTDYIQAIDRDTESFVIGRQVGNPLNDNTKLLINNGNSFDTTELDNVLMLSSRDESKKWSVDKDMVMSATKAQSLELTATDRGLLLNRVTTAQMNGIVSPTTNEIVYNTDLNGLYRYDGAAWVGLSAGYGLVSVTDSSGTPTFYATIQSAITNSSSGETVTLHTDITETSTTTINLKDGVNINLNGYTYTLNQASTNNCFSDNNIALECHIMNGVVKRTGGTFSSSNSFCLEVDGNSLIKCHTTVFESDFGTAARVDGTVEGGVFKGIQGAYINSGKLKNAICYGTTSNGITAINVGSIYNCKGYSDSGDGIIGAGYIFNCYGESYSGNGVNCNTSSFSFNVTGVSNSGIGVTIDSDGMNINGKSNSNYGVRLESGFNSVTDVKGYSNSNYGVSFSSGSGNGVFTNIVAHSKSNIAMSMLINAGSVYFTNITAITEWNNTGGHGIVVAGSDTDHYIIGAKIKVASSSAYGISGSKSIHYSNVNVVGATTGIDPSITNLTTNIIDSQGNITTN